MSVRYAKSYANPYATSLQTGRFPLISTAVSYDRFLHQLVSGLRTLQRDHRDDHAMHVGMDYAAQSGLWLEFGVYQGNTLGMMADRRRPRLVHGFDSFRGLPERWRNVEFNLDLEKYVKKGAFDMNGVPPHIPQTNVAFLVGLFNQTLPRFLSDNPNSTISFLHVDCDLYSSALYVLRKCRPRLARGSVLVFDELVNFREYAYGEALALWSTFYRKNATFEIIGHSLDTVVGSPIRETWPQAVALRLVALANTNRS